MRYKRRKIQFIDKSVQGQLVVRVFAYWTLSMFGMFCLLAGIPIVMSWFVNSEGAPAASELILQTCGCFGLSSSHLV